MFTNKGFLDKVGMGDRRGWVICIFWMDCGKLTIKGESDMGCMGVCMCSECICVYECVLVRSDGGCAGVAHFSDVCVCVCMFGGGVWGSMYVMWEI